MKKMLFSLMKMNIDCITPSHESVVYTNKLESSDKKPKKSNQRRSDERKKLLAFEINFILSNVEANSTIVYIGETYKLTKSSTNHGENIYVLANLFPFLNFEVYDDEEFTEYYNPELFNLSNVTIFGRMPTEEEYDMYREKTVYLIANIVERSIRMEKTYDVKHKENASKEIKRLHEEKVEFFNLKEKMNLISLNKSSTIVKKIYPKSSLLRFRPNHVNINEFSFFDGILLLPIFSDEKSAECRLIVNYEYIDVSINWNFEQIFFNLNYWNDIEREKPSLNPFTNTLEPLLCYGNKMEYCIFFSILKEYFKTIGYMSPTEEDIQNLMNLYINKKI